eukprot:365810-Chlamydomonas_euryale.AAC.31
MLAAQVYKWGSLLAELDRVVWAVAPKGGAANGTDKAQQCGLLRRFWKVKNKGAVDRIDPAS